MKRIYTAHCAEQYDLSKSEDIQQLEKKHPGVDVLQGSYFSSVNGYPIYNVGEGEFQFSGLPGDSFFISDGKVQLIDRDNKAKYPKEDPEVYKEDLNYLKGIRKIRVSTDGWFENYPLDKIHLYLRIEAEKNPTYIVGDGEKWNPEDEQPVIFEKDLGSMIIFKNKLVKDANGREYLKDMDLTINYIEGFPLFVKVGKDEYRIHQYNPKYRKVKYALVFKSIGQHWLDSNRPIYLRINHQPYIASMEVYTIHNNVSLTVRPSTDGRSGMYDWRSVYLDFTGIIQEDVKDLIIQTTVELNHSKGKVTKKYDFSLRNIDTSNEIDLLNVNASNKSLTIRLYRHTLDSEIYQHLDKSTRTWVFMPPIEGSTELEVALNYGEWIPFFDHTGGNLTGRIRYEIKRVKGNRFYYRVPTLSKAEEDKQSFNFTLKGTNNVTDLGQIFLTRVWYSDRHTTWSNNIYQKPYQKIQVYGQIYKFPALINPDEVEFYMVGRHKRRDNGEWVEVEYRCENLIYDNEYLHNGGNKNKDKWMRNAMVYESIPFTFDISNHKGYPLPTDESYNIKVKNNEFTEGKYGFKFVLPEKYRYQSKFLENYGVSYFARYRAGINELCTSPFIYQFAVNQRNSYTGTIGNDKDTIPRDTTYETTLRFIRNIYSDRSFILGLQHLYKDKLKQWAVEVKVEQSDGQGNWVLLQQYDLVKLLNHPFFKSYVQVEDYNGIRYTKKFNFDTISSKTNRHEPVKYHTRLANKKAMGEFWDVILPFPVFYQMERNENYETIASYEPEKYREEHGWLYKETLPGSTRGIRSDLADRIRFVINTYAIGKEGEYNGRKLETFKPWINEFELRDYEPVEVLQQGDPGRWIFWESSSSNVVEIAINLPEHPDILKQIESVTYVADKYKLSLADDPEYKVTYDDYTGKSNKYYYIYKVTISYQEGDGHWYCRFYDRTSNSKGKNDYTPMPVSDYVANNDIMVVSDQDRDKDNVMHQGLIPVWKKGTSEAIKQKFAQLFTHGYFPIESFRFTPYSQV